MFTENQSCVLVTDFDGTATKTDFFYHVLDRLLSNDDAQSWEDYKAGKITHFEGLNRIFRKIHLDIEEFQEFIRSIPIEDGFVSTVKFCIDNNISIYIVSAGADYYIKHILEALCLKDHIKIIANESFYSPEEGLQMIKLKEDSIFYSNNYGINKELVVKFLKNKYEKVIFAGDGVPDFYAAKHADVIFARGELLSLCEKNNIDCQELKSFHNVLDYLEGTIK